MNIAYRIRKASEIYGDKPSVSFSARQKDGSYKYPFYTFSEFEERSNQFAHKLVKQGIRPGMRTLLFVKPCLDFSIITFALFKIGAIPVLIDPGMGIKNLLRSIKQVRPEAMVSVGLVHWIRRFKPAPFSDVKIKVSLQKVGFSTSWIYEDLEKEPKQFDIYEAKPSDYAAILFTSGGTGIPKGVLYTHEILNAQTDALKEMFDLNPNQKDLPGFPLFALFTLAMGMTSVVPDLDPTKPAQCHPDRIVKNILDNNITFVAGSPSIWERVGEYCLEHKIKLPTVKYVVMFGAPVRTEIHQMFQEILDGGDTYTPYGATEGLPVSIVSGREVLSQIKTGHGTLIGKAAPGAEIKIIKTTDIPESSLQELQAYEVGEITVSGKQITPAYFEMPSHTANAKIITDKLWHRMGDMGYLDDKNQLWFMGRKAHRVELKGKTHYSIPVESIFNQHPEIKRTALVKLEKAQKIGIVIERHDQSTKMGSQFLSELKSLAQSHPVSQEVEAFLLYSKFPVDVRHNIKIDRGYLQAWANQQKG